MRYLHAVAKESEMHPVRPLTVAAARVLTAATKAEKITQTAIAERLDRTQGYVSEHLAGKKAIDTDDLDVIAELMGITGIELLRRIANDLDSGQGRSSNVTPLPKTPIAPTALDDLEVRRGQTRSRRTTKIAAAEGKKDQDQ